MKFVEEYRDPELGKKLLERIHRRSRKPVRLMEFCGGHTVAIFKHGLRQLLPENIRLLSGPGCPGSSCPDVESVDTLGQGYQFTGGTVLATTVTNPRGQTTTTRFNSAGYMI